MDIWLHESISVFSSWLYLYRNHFFFLKIWQHRTRIDSCHACDHKFVGRLCSRASTSNSLTRSFNSDHSIPFGFRITSSHLCGFQHQLGVRTCLCLLLTTFCFYEFHEPGLFTFADKWKILEMYFLLLNIKWGFLKTLLQLLYI